jgi:hypothetical protein
MGFFQHTPELVLAQLEDPRTLRLVDGNNSLANKLLSTSRQVKYQMYRDHWPDLQARPKFDGGEYVRDITQGQGNKLDPNRQQRAALRWYCSHSEIVARLTREAPPAG